MGDNEDKINKLEIDSAKIYVMLSNVDENIKNLTKNVNEKFTRLEHSFDKSESERKLADKEIKDKVHELERTQSKHSVAIKVLFACMTIVGSALGIKFIPFSIFG